MMITYLKAAHGWVDNYIINGVSCNSNGENTLRRYDVGEFLDSNGDVATEREALEFICVAWEQSQYKGLNPFKVLRAVLLRGLLGD